MPRARAVRYPKCVNLAVTPEEYAYVKTKADEQGTTMSNIVRSALGWPHAFKGRPALTSAEREAKCQAMTSASRSGN